MLGAGLQFGGRGEDRFYNPARARKNRLNRAQSDVTPDRSSTTTSFCGGDTTAAAVESSPSCNLERFLDSVRPTVPAQYLSKRTMRGWRTCDVEYQPYFVLGDLWESFKEWSAYGAGVPLIMNDSDGVVQYYVPYLSGIQLYGDPLKSSEKSRRPGDDSDVDSCMDSSSDGSSDNEHKRGSFGLREKQNYNYPKNGISVQMERLPVKDQHLSPEEGFSSDDSESGNSQGYLLFEYLERNQPYGREPLADKISDLARSFPMLKTIRSCDLLPSSWISVAWYPIYRIPTGPTLKDLDACFLTFHCLHTSVTGSQCVDAPLVTYPNDVDGVPKLTLPVFGLAWYKFKASLWTQIGGCERPLGNSLLQAACDWLTTLQVNHPDFLFFSRR